MASHIDINTRNLSKSNAGMIPSRKKQKSGKENSFMVPVRKYESADERQARIDKRRNGANKWTLADVPCYLCSEIHPIHKCNLLPLDEHERKQIFLSAAALNPCWKCGEIGHVKKEKDCPSTPQASRPRLTLPPTIDSDVASVVSASE